jgi:hypothetical protein
MSFIDDLRRRATGILGDDYSGMSSDAMPPITNERGVVPAPSLRPDRKSPFRNPGVDPFKSITQNTQSTNTAPDAVTMGQKKFGLGEKQFQNIFGISYGDAAARWKDKGGFEGLMANPGFTLGLAIMKSSARGEPISQSLLDNAVGAGAISSQYADRIRDRKQAPIEATAENIENVKQLLRTMDIEEPNFFERVFGKIKGENKQAQYEEAAESIAVEFEKEMAKAAAAAKREGKSPVFDTAFKKKIIRKLVKQGKIKKKGGIPFITKATVEAKSEDPFRQTGGTVAKNESYVVGETGPEIFTPKQSGNVISNDDSKVVNMLLDANPQLKNVSLDRATKILKNRFPDYF